MAKFLVTNDSNFTPFTYDELVKPVMLAQEAHNKAQETYDALALETSALKHYISDNPGDSDAKLLYDNYMNKLSDLQNNLWNTGINAQTKRDLSTARNAYSSDILRLSKAIENRQARSKEFWDMQHNNPDMVMGVDPGTLGLNYYLKDDNFGRNYFSYNGAQFMKEVGADALARASELLSNPSITRPEELEGYARVVERNGFSNTEVNKATAAARDYYNGNVDSDKNLTPAEKILFDTLVSHMNATGARRSTADSEGNISDSNFFRLFDYGAQGLAQGVGKATSQYLTDKKWVLEHQKKKDGDEDNSPSNYFLGDKPYEASSPEYIKYQSDVEDQASAYKDGPVVITRPDGTSSTLSDLWQATEEIYNPEVRKKARVILHGLDVGYTDRTQSISFTDENGRTYKRKTTNNITSELKKLGFKDGDTIVYDPDTNMYDLRASRLFNQYRADYLAHVDAYKAANPKIERHRIAISPEKERDMRKDYGIDPTVDTSMIPSVIEASANHGMRASAIIADTGEDFKNFRETLQNDITVNMARNPTGSKSSLYNAYKVVNDGANGKKVSEEGTTDIFNGGKNKILFVEAPVARPGKVWLTLSDGNTWEVDKTLLSDNIKNAFDERGTKEFAHGIYQNGNNDIRMPKAIENMNTIEMLSLPLSSNGVKTILKMNGDDLRALNAYIHNSLKLHGIPSPKINGRNATVLEIIKNPELQNELENAVKMFMNMSIASARDEQVQNPMQSKGFTNKDAAPYNANQNIIMLEDEE